MNIDCFHSQELKIVNQIIKSFGNKDTENFFMKLGILPKEKEGYVYPNSMQAASILDALRFEMERLTVSVITDTHVTAILPKGKGFQIQAKDKTFHGRRVILAAGGCASEKLGSDGSGFKIVKGLGYSLIPIVPALTGLKASEKVFKSLAGIRAEGRVTLFIDDRYVDVHEGEIQLADYGISGIPVFQLSSAAAYGLLNHKKVVCEMDFFPDMKEKDLAAYLIQRKNQFGKASVETFETGLLNRKLIHEIIKMAGKKDVQGYPDMKHLAHLIKHFPATITASRGYEFAQVCAGGISLKSIYAESMESKRHPGLYFVGEILDVDGICGGYNLQWAWATGYLAGLHAGKECHASHRTN